MSFDLLAILLQVVASRACNIALLYHLISAWPNWHLNP